RGSLWVHRDKNSVVHKGSLVQSLSLDATPLDIITHCFMLYHHLFAQSVFNPSSGRCPPWADMHSTSSFLRTLLASVSSCASSSPPLTAPFLLRSRAGAADPPESLRTMYRAAQRGLDRCHTIEYTATPKNILGRSSRKGRCWGER